MPNQTTNSELIELKKHILNSMTDYLPNLVNNDVSIPLNLTACEAALRAHLGDVILEAAWEDTAALVFEVRWVLNSLRNSPFHDMVAGATIDPPDEAKQQAFLEECRAVVGITLVNRLVPAAKDDLSKLMCALRNAMLALAQLSLDAICDDVHRKQDGYREFIYTEADIAQCDAVLTHYLDTVQSAPVKNDSVKIMVAVQTAVESLNDLNDRCGSSLIETDAREDICKLIQEAAERGGLSCDDMDITEEWREW